MTANNYRAIGELDSILDTSGAGQGAFSRRQRSPGSMEDREEERVTPLLRPAEVAEILGVSRSQVSALKRKGKLRAVMIESSPRYEVSELERYISGCRNLDANNRARAADALRGVRRA